MIARRAIDQLRGDPNAAAGLAHAALEDVTHAELAGEVANIDRLSLEGEGGVPGRYRQSRHLRQIGCDVLADAVAEIFLLGVAAHVRKRQHANRDIRLAGPPLW